MVALLVTMATVTQIEKSSIQFTQNKKLINLIKFQAKLITLSWDKMSQSVFSMPVARGIAHSNRGKKFWNNSKIFYYILSCYIKIYSMLWLIVEFWYFSFLFWIWVENPLKYHNQLYNIYKKIWWWYYI